MRLNLGNKILILLHWLCSLMICVAFALCIIVPDLRGDLIARAESSLGSVGARVLGAVLLALYVALSVAVLLRLVRGRRREEQGFITVGSDEKGRVRIAVSAVEQMVRQSVRSIDGISDMKIDIEGADEAIIIGITATIANGAHVPTLTANMRRAITQFVEDSCGVAVQSVTVTIDAVNGKADASRHMLGRNKPQADMATPTYAPQASASGYDTEPEPVSMDDAPVAEPATRTWESVPAAETTAEAEDTAKTEAFAETQTPAYDPDKPYESEFAKDYAAMKARENGGDVEAPEDTEPEE